MALFVFASARRYVFATNVRARVTSSSLCVIMVKALKTQSVEPVMVMILSGQEPSEMLTRALLCGHNCKVKPLNCETLSTSSNI